MKTAISTAIRKASCGEAPRNSGRCARRAKPGVIFAAILTLLLVSTPHSSPAASDRCTVERSDGTVLVLKCTRKTDSFQPGTGVKIKSDRKASDRDS